MIPMAFFCVLMSGVLCREVFDWVYVRQHEPELKALGIIQAPLGLRILAGVTGAIIAGSVCLALEIR